MATIHEIKERPILFSAPMVRAILAGTKTQTRRVVHNPHRHDGGFVLQDYGNGWWPYRSHDGESGHYLDRQKDGDYYSEAPLRCPYGQPGDRLWVRETWGYFDPDCSGYEKEIEDRGKGPGLHCATEMMQEGHPLRDFWRRRVAYAATWEEPKFGNGPDKPSRWRPSIHMPRWASRITLEVTGVRVERLQDISETDAQAEGARECDPVSGREVLLAGPSQRGSFVLHYRDIWEQINGPESWDANPWVWVIEFKRIDAAMKEQDHG